MARKSKYAAVIPHLPRLDGVEPERRDLVEAIKTEILAPPDDEEVISRDLDVHRAADRLSAHIGELLHLIKRSTAGRQYAAEFARAYADARDLRDRIDAWQAAANLLIEALQILMINQMDAEGISSLKLTNGRPVTTYKEPYAQIIDRDAFRQWCLQDPDLARRMALPWQSLNSLVKERLVAGEPEPPGVTAYARDVVRLGSE